MKLIGLLLGLLLVINSAQAAVSPTCAQIPGLVCVGTSVGATTVTNNLTLSGTAGLSFGTISAPSCGAGQFFIYSDGTNLKKCENSAVSNMGAGAGTVAWDAITTPAGNATFTMGAKTTTVTYNSATGAANLWTLTDTATNGSASGILMNILTTSGSSLVPLRVLGGGTNGVQVTAAGILQKVASGSVLADNLNIASQATGDLVYNNAGTWTRVPAGTTTQVLHGASGIPTWASVVAADLASNTVTGAKVSNSFLIWNEISTPGTTAVVLANTPRNITTNKDAVLLISNGIVQTQVASGPGANEFTFNSGTHTATWAADPGSVTAIYETDL